VFGQLLKRAGLSSFRAYDLRHTFASLLLAQGVPITSSLESLSRPTLFVESRTRYRRNLADLQTRLGLGPVLLNHREKLPLSRYNPSVRADHVP
jgi:hypothetical protein